MGDEWEQIQRYQLRRRSKIIEDFHVTLTKDYGQEIDGILLIGRTSHDYMKSGFLIERINSPYFAPAANVIIKEDARPVDIILSSNANQALFEALLAVCTKLQIQRKFIDHPLEPPEFVEYPWI